jgi:hypothetical protein
VPLTQAPRTITADPIRHTMNNSPVNPGELAYSLILFPAEAGPPQILRLQLKDQNPGQVYTMTFFL